MRRYLPSLAGAVSAMLLFGVLSGAAAGGLFLTILVVIPVGLGVGRWLSRRDRTGEGVWARDEVVAFVPSAGHVPGGSGGVTLALGRVEARELSASASFGVGIGFCILVVGLFGWVWIDDAGGDVLTYVSLFAILLHPLVGMAMLGAFRARTRGRREGVEELFTTCPTSDATRSLAHLTTGWVPAVTALLTAGVLLLGLYVRAPIVFGNIGAEQVAQIAVLAVLAVGGVALGVLLARTLPWTLVPVVVLVALAFVTAGLASNGISTNAVRQLSTWIGDTDLDVRFAAPHWLAHVLWLTALVVIVAVLAVLRDRRTPLLLGIGGVAVVAAMASGVAATAAIRADDAQRIAALLAEPLEAQECVDTGPVSVCSFGEDHELRDQYVDAIAPVIAAVPGDFSPVVIRYAADVDLVELDPEVRALLPEPAHEPGLVPVDMVAVDDAYDGARIWVGLAGAGVLEDRRAGQTVDVRGQSRGVLALWLATRGADAGTVHDLTRFDQVVQQDDVDHHPWPDPCYAGIAPVVWDGADVDAARALTTLPDDVVAAAVAAGWERFTDPATSTDELLAAVGLDPIEGPLGRTRLTEC